MSASRISRIFQLAQRRAFSSTRRRLDNYGFVGLGQMGYQMAKNLQSKLSVRDKIIVFDINEDAMERFASDIKDSKPGGATISIASSSSEAAETADALMTVLPEPSHVKSVYSSILASDLPDQPRLFIDCSTIDPSTSRDIAKSVTEASSGKSHFLDAPMSGGVVGARAGTLTFMLGCSDDLFARAEAILLRMGKRVLRCGKQGTGLSAKLANNYLLAINNIATAEAMNLGIRWGLEPKTLAGILNVSTGKCWPSEVNNPVPGVIETAPSSREYAGGFGVSLMRKDLGLAMQAAEEVGARLELAQKARDVYEGAEGDDRCKGKDFSVVYRYIDGQE